MLAAAMVTVVDHSCAKLVQMDHGNFTVPSAGDQDAAMPLKGTLFLQELPSSEVGSTKRCQDNKSIYHSTKYCRII